MGIFGAASAVVFPSECGVVDAEPGPEADADATGLLGQPKPSPTPVPVALARFSNPGRGEACGPVPAPSAGVGGAPAPAPAPAPARCSHCLIAVPTTESCERAGIGGAISADIVDGGIGERTFACCDCDCDT